MDFHRFIVRSQDIAKLEGVSIRSGQMKLKQLKADLNLNGSQRRPSLADYARWRGWNPEEVIALAAKDATAKRTR